MSATKSRPVLPLTFLLQSVLCQGIGFAFDAFLRDQLIEVRGLKIDWILLFLAVGHGLVAFGFANFLKLPRPWAIANLLLAPAVLLSLNFGLSSNILAAAFICTALLFLPTFWTRVPYYPTSLPAYELLLKELPANGPFSFADLGCGFSGLLMYIARNRPDANLIGYEISPLAWLISKIRTIRKRKQIKILFKSFWDADLSSFDYVYAFLAPPPMPQVWDYAQKSMNRKAILIVNSFPVPATPIKEIEIGDKKGGRLYIYSLANE